MYQIEHYLSQDGRDLFAEWLASLADRRARAFGDCKPVGEGVWEARIDYGPGYRVYYARAGSRLVVLLIGGDKRKQKADIENAVDYWNDWQKRNRK
jgi:putative addiction module killer protein